MTAEEKKRIVQRGAHFGNSALTGSLSGDIGRLLDLFLDTEAEFEEQKFSWLHDEWNKDKEPEFHHCTKCGRRDRWDSRHSWKRTDWLREVRKKYELK